MKAKPKKSQKKKVVFDLKPVSVGAAKELHKHAATEAVGRGAAG